MIVSGASGGRNNGLGGLLLSLLDPINVRKDLFDHRRSNEDARERVTGGRGVCGQEWQTQVGMKTLNLSSKMVAIDADI